jgi:dimethylaniline monooxygenase (N-oxide forming)
MIWNTIIIGSGISGLFVLKHLKELGNDNVLVLDKNPEPFGVWNIKNHPSVHEFTYCVSSKLYMTITDFPIPSHYPEFPSHEEILEYYKRYAQHFDLLKHVQCNIQVRKVQKQVKDNLWQVEVEQTQSNQRFQRFLCQHLVIACGTVNNCLNIPTEPFYNKFTGLKFHADDYETYKPLLKNKRIVLVGVSDTACDIAEELKQKNNTIFLSSRQGVWFQSRNIGANSPADMIYNVFVDNLIKHFVGKELFQYVFVGRQFWTIPFWWGENGHGIPEWATDVGYLNHYYVKSRDILSSIAKGQMKPKKGIADINNRAISFVDDPILKEENVDVIIFCTGYQPFGGLFFFEDDKYYKKRYKHIFSYADNYLYFVGYIRPYLTSIPMLSELQSRWIAHEIMFKNTLPSDKFKQWCEIQQDEETQAKEFPLASKRLKTIVDPYDYCNMVAEKIGVKPSIYYLFMNFSLHLVFQYIFCSWNPHFFRLYNKYEYATNSKKNKTVNKEKIQIAYENIQETTRNDTNQKLLFLFFFFFYPFYKYIFLPSSYSSNY